MRLQLINRMDGQPWRRDAPEEGAEIIAIRRERNHSSGFGLERCYVKNGLVITRWGGNSISPKSVLGWVRCGEAA